MRASGILLPISSLNNRYGIGTFGLEAYKFIDFLNDSGQKFWQVLPLGPTSFGDSPYQTFSVFAGNPYFVDFDLLKDEKLLEYNEYQNMVCSEGDIDYLFQYENRYLILKKAYKRFKGDEKYNKFLNDNKDWLNDYAMFMAIKSITPKSSWEQWDRDYRFRQGEKYQLFIEKNKDEIDFWKFIQYCFLKQWKDLKNYANKKGIKIIGDLPIYVAYDSSDIWSNPLNWQLDGNLMPLAVAGCPPDEFALDGQLWGNPLYNYSLMAKDGFSWWINRFKHAFELFDYVRVDHFRGFEAYYSIPYPARNAKSGSWVKGPGLSFFQKIKEKLGNLNIIAEDLGFLTDKVYQLRDDAGFMGMKVLQFAFNHDKESEYLPHNHIKHSICYTGTHDNPPTKAWLKILNEKDLTFLYKYLDIKNDDEALEKVIEAALASVCNFSIIPMQDYLGLGEEARINRPATIGGNWLWRLKDNDLNKELSAKILTWTKTYKR